MNKFTIGNTAAVKPEHLLQTAKVVLCVTPAEKAALIQAAMPKSLARYMRAKLGMA